MVSNCYNIGKITASGTNSITTGSIVGYTKADTTIENCKWLAGTDTKAVGNILSGNVIDNSICVNTLEEMPDILEVINGENAFKSDTNNINNGYPILAWQN